MAKNFKASSYAMRVLDNSTEELIVVVASPSAGTILSKSTSSKAHLYSIDSSSALPSTTLISHTPNPNISEQVHSTPHIFEQVHSELAYTFEQVHFQTISAPQTTNQNITTPSPTTSVRPQS